METLIIYFSFMMDYIFYSYFPSSIWYMNFISTQLLMIFLHFISLRGMVSCCRRSMFAYEDQTAEGFVLLIQLKIIRFVVLNLSFRYLTTQGQLTFRMR